MHWNVTGRLVVVLLSAVLVGCLPGKPEGSVPTEELFSDATPGELVAEFASLAQNPSEASDDFRRFLITKQLARMGPRTLVQIIEIMASPDSSGETKLFTLQSLHGLVGPSYIPELKALLESEDAVVRACSISLLGHILDPQVMPVLQAHAEDPVWSVRFASLSGMATQGDANSRGKLAEMYFSYPEEDPEAVTDPEQVLTVREEILRVLLLDPEPEDFDILLHAVTESSTDMTTRVLIVALAHGIGDTDSIEPLELSIATNADAEYAKFVRETIDVIREREQAVTAGR